MASKTGIINLALRNIAASRITSATDGSKNANVANDLYDETLERCLRAGNWNFATHRVKLVQLAAAPVSGFKNAFTKPADWVRTVAVHDNDQGVGTVKFKLEGIGFLSDVEELWLTYVRLEVDPNQMTADFRDYFARELAKGMALSVAASNTVREENREEVKAAKGTALSVDAIEDIPEQQPQGSWVEDRPL